jgi:HEAT repeat protein
MKAAGGSPLGVGAKYAANQALSALTDLLKDERTASDSRRSAVAALGEIGGPEAFSAMPALIRHIGGESRDLEATAVYCAEVYAKMFEPVGMTQRQK